MIWLWRVLASVGLCLMLALYGLLFTAAGTHWSLELLQELLPDLEIDYRGGSWVSGLQASRLRYAAPMVEVTISNLSVRVTPLALLSGTLAAPSVEADRVVLRLIDPGTAPKKNGLPTVAFPVTLSVANLAVPDFELITLGGRSVTAAIQTALRWRGTWIDASAATLTAYGFQIDTDLAIQLQGDYAVAADLILRQLGQPHEFEAELGGSLQQLGVAGYYRGLAPLRYRGQVRLLDPGLPLELAVHAEPGAALALGDDKLDIEQGRFDLNGDLGHLQGVLQAELAHEQLGPAQLHVPLSWRDAQLRVANGRLSTGQGSLTTQCAIDTRASAWQCQGLLAELSPSPWFDLVSVRVSSPFQLRGAWGERAAPALELELASVSGHLGDQALEGAVSLRSPDWQQWQLRRLRLKAGANRVVLSGELGQQLDLRVRIVADDLAQLASTAAGAFNGQFAVGGSLAAPTITGRMQGSELRWRELFIQRLRGHADVVEIGRAGAQASLHATALRYGQTALGDLRFALHGKLVKHELDLTLKGGDYQLRLQCGGQQTDYWLLRCNRLEGMLAMRGQLHAFGVDEPLRIEWREQLGELRLAANCLRMHPATLCLPRPLRWRDGALDGAELSLRRLPLQWWTAALPSTIAVRPNSYLRADLKVGGWSPLQALLTARIDELHWTWQGEGETFPASMEAIALRLAMNEQQAVLTGEARSAALGDLQAMLVVDEPAGRQALDGRLMVDDLQLRAFSWLSDTIQRLRGVLDGDIRITGNAASPRLDGALALRDGLLRDLSLPYPIEQVSADVVLDQERADIAGRFRFNDGGGTLQGRLRWWQQAPRWRLDTVVATDYITVPVLESSVAKLAARVKLGLEPGLLEVGGKVIVDQADIRLITLPPNSIATSPDSEIVGAQARTAWRFNSDLQIDLGERLRFRGFGVDMTLTGALRLRNSRRYRDHFTGEVRVARGRFRAYGQDLTIRNGRLIFAGIASNPDLQLEAVRDSRDRQTIAGLRVSGTLQDPVGEFFAEPSMTDSDVAYFLLTGRRPPEPGQQGTGSGGVLLNLGLARTNESAAKLASRLGIEGFQISTADGESGLETQFSGYLTDDLFVSYGTGFEEKTNSLTLQYYITPHIVIEAVGGFTSALDLVYSFRID